MQQAAQRTRVAASDCATMSRRSDGRAGAAVKTWRRLRGDIACTCMFVLHENQPPAIRGCAAAGVDRLVNINSHELKAGSHSPIRIRFGKAYLTNLGYIRESSRDFIFSMSYVLFRSKIQTSKSVTSNIAAAP